MAATAANSITLSDAEIVNVCLFRRANLRNRYAIEGGHACTGSSCKYRCTSAAKALAVS
jgi:hypothetical protein